MRDLIRKILREEFNSENRRVLTYRSLSKGERTKIKTKGDKIFEKLKSYNLEKLNDFFKEHGLFLGAPSKEFLKNNINDAKYALEHLPLSLWARKKLSTKKFEMEMQHDAIEKYERGEIPHKGRWYEFFHEKASPEEKKEAVWSFVNLFNNNVTLWVQLINDWMFENPETQNIKSKSELIDSYFSQSENNVEGGKAFYDLRIAMVERGKHEENIIKRTWGGGRETERKFISELTNNGFTNIRVFSGEGNVVDNVGIDLAVICHNKWIPIQVKSNQNEANESIPYEGFAAFPYGDTFKLISKLGRGKDQRNLVDLCEPLNKPVEKKHVSKIPSNVDYVGHMGWR